MLMPARDGVALAADADGGEDRVPELVHRLLLGKLGEDLLRPARDGDGCDAPGIHVRHHCVVEGGDLVIAAICARDAVRVHAAQHLGIASRDAEIRCALGGVAVEKFLLSERERVKDGIVRAQEALAVHVVVRPAHHDLAAADIVGGGGAQAREKRAVDGTGDDERLPFLNVQAHFDEQLCIFSEFFFHEDPPQKEGRLCVAQPPFPIVRCHTTCIITQFMRD